MKVTSVEPHLIDTGDDNLTFVKVETDEGIFGLGEAAILSGFAVVGSIRFLRDLVIGEDPFSTEHLWQKMYRAGATPADRVVCAAISAIDIALWDIKGKALGMPVYKLLGGPTRDTINCFKHIMNSDGNVEGLVKNAEQAVSEGHKFLRWWLYETEPGVFDPVEAVRHMVKQVDAVREAVGYDLGLILDYHTRVDTDMAIWLSKELEPYRPLVIEDPIRPDNPASYRNFARQVSLPIAAGEHWGNKWQFREVIEEELIHIARPDVTMAGGITEAKKIAAMCETHHISVVPHGAVSPISTAACNHLNFSNPSMPWGDASPDTGTLLRDIFPVQPTFVKGSMIRNEAPGLGVEINEDALSKYASNPQRARSRFKSKDGAISNW